MMHAGKQRYKRTDKRQTDLVDFASHSRELRILLHLLSCSHVTCMQVYGPILQLEQQQSCSRAVICIQECHLCSAHVRRLPQLVCLDVFLVDSQTLVDEFCSGAAHVGVSFSLFLVVVTCKRVHMYTCVV